MKTYHCTNCALDFTPADETWEQVIDTNCCPICNKKLTQSVIYPLLSDEHSKYWFSIFNKSKYLLMIPIIIIIASAYPGLWAAYSLPQGHWLPKKIVLLLWTPAYCLFMSYLNSINVMRLRFSIPFTFLMLILAFNFGKHDPRVAQATVSLHYPTSKSLQ